MSSINFFLYFFLFPSPQLVDLSMTSTLVVLVIFVQKFSHIFSMVHISFFHLLFSWVLACSDYHNFLSCLEFKLKWKFMGSNSKIHRPGASQIPKYYYILISQPVGIWEETFFSQEAFSELKVRLPEESLCSYYHYILNIPDIWFNISIVHLHPHPNENTPATNIRKSTYRFCTITNIQKKLNIVFLLLPTLCLIWPSSFCTG